ncbi:dephospho-CoA kinase [Clostridium culturomicium]|uniref:dephospho-CoA kinase n=1 Tax=Clostridium culturomicium TaxID=1499683 RepID=UPI0006938FB7|nr:dephospho-CoA kinase [Clostridium culturomicium]
MKQNKILKVGLTGGIGSGKSTVSSMVKNQGIPVIDADMISRKVLSSHPEILIKIKETFGEEFFDEDGNFLRRKMGELIFSNKEKKDVYEGILMPYILKDIFMEIDEYDNMGEEICVLDAPTLIENNLHEEMDFVIVIAIMKELQISRVMARDEFTREEAINRINNQMSTEEKVKYADYLIDNGDTLEYTKFQVDSIIKELKEFRGKNVL